MNKTIISYLIAFTFTICTNSFGMLRQTARITRTKKVFITPKKFHTTPLIWRSKQQRTAEENNLLLQKISAQLDAIQKQLESTTVENKEKTKDKDDNRNNSFDHLRVENERHLRRHREHGGFDSSNPHPYNNYEDYVRYNSY